VLKRVTLSSDTAGEAGGEPDVSSEESELRLRRSLEMLGSGVKRDTARDQDRDVFRDVGRDPVRETQRERPREGMREPLREPFHSRDHGRDQPARDHTSKTPGFTPSGARRHRFKDDGEVPVVHVAAHRDRSQLGFPGGTGAGNAAPSGRNAHFADPHVTEERSAREKAERALEAARESVHHLQTRVGHAELALREALGQVEAREQMIASLRMQLSAEQEASLLARHEAEHADKLRRDAEASLQAKAEQHRQAVQALKSEIAALRASGAAQQTMTFARPAKAPARVVKPMKARAPKVVLPDEDEQEPVKWWLTSEAKAKPATRRKG
jgi:hypothetical protein